MQYKATFRDDKNMIHKLKFFASHKYQADRKAQGIAKSNGWKVTSMGSI